MNIKFFNVFFILFIILSRNDIYAYEIDMHGFITYEGYKQSLLMTDKNLLNELGIKNSANAFRNVYYEMDAVDPGTGEQTIRVKTNQPYEDLIIEDRRKINQRPLSIEAGLYEDLFEKMIFH